VQSVAFSPDGAMLAIADESESTYLWSVPGTRLIATLSPPGTGAIGMQSVAFSRDGHVLAIATVNSHTTTSLWARGAKG
jgi:WD40 repeat protein